jgi:hypothetical protein
MPLTGKARAVVAPAIDADATGAEGAAEKGSTTIR